MRNRFLLVFATIALLAFVSCGGQDSSSKPVGDIQIAVYVPGTQASPVYAMMVSGVQKAAAEREGTTVKVIEAGYNQAEWLDKLTALATTGSYDLIVTSNPSMPDYVVKVLAQAPNQKFLLLDGYLSGNPNACSFKYNQREQAYLAGYMAGLYTKSGLPGMNKDLKIGLIAGQEYPDMNKVMLPAYEEGANAAAPGAKVDFRIVGNWSDAAKGAELAKAMFAQGVDVVLPICGEASQGVLTACIEAKAKVLWFDTNGYALAPGTVVGSAIIRQDIAAYDKVKLFLEGKLPFGQADIAGVKEGYVDFVQDDPDYFATVPVEIQKAIADILAKIRDGSLVLSATLP